MSEEIAQALYDLAHWKQRAEQTEAMLRTITAALEQAEAESVQLMAGMRRASDELDAARRAIDLARTAVRRGVFPRELREAIEEYDRLVKR